MLILTFLAFLGFLLICLLAIDKLSSYYHKKEVLKSQQNANAEEDKFDTELNKLDIFLLIAAIFFCLVALITPFTFTQIFSEGEYSFIGKGEIGDTFGGLMSPFVNFSAVIVTGLAFYMQYRANRLQVHIFRKQLKEDQQQFKEEQNEQRKNVHYQKFESQFYEMLRLHKENVNEIEIEGKKRKKVKQAAKAFTDSTGRKTTLKRTNHIFEYDDYIISKRNAFVEMQNELEYIIKVVTETGIKLDKKIFKSLYGIYFWGISEKEVLSETDLKIKKFKSTLLEIQMKQFSEQILNINKDLPFYIPAFRGHSNFLGHYYRHLFHTVKFVADYDETIVDRNKKKELLRLLRAQLSNHEQALLFYNWLSDYGDAWQNSKNNFLTEYKMIHNLWHSEISKYNFIRERLNELFNIYKRFGNPYELFEIEFKPAARKYNIGRKKGQKNWLTRWRKPKKRY